jgi:hypothetical protein
MQAHCGTVSAVNVLHDAGIAGFGEGCLKKAKKQLGIESRLKNHMWYWITPQYTTPLWQSGI